MKQFLTFLRFENNFCEFDTKNGIFLKIYDTIINERGVLPIEKSNNDRPFLLVSVLF